MAPPDQSTTVEVTPNLIERVAEFNRIGQITPPNQHFNADRVCFYTGMQCEELAEKIQAISDGCVSRNEREAMAFFARTMQLWGMSFKAGQHVGAVLRADREELLDADIDILVVSSGALVYQTPRYRGAVEEVLSKNDAKCPGGVATHDANGKIVKPTGWTKPNLTPFVDHHGE